MRFKKTAEGRQIVPTEKQGKFYLLVANGATNRTEAAIQAGFSPKCAAVVASRLMRDLELYPTEIAKWLANEVGASVPTALACIKDVTTNPEESGKTRLLGAQIILALHGITTSRQHPGESHVTQQFQAPTVVFIGDDERSRKAREQFLAGEDESRKVPELPDKT